MQERICHSNFLGPSLMILALLWAVAGTANANGQKSLYVNRDLNANSPIRAYAIQDAPTYLTYQMDSNTTHYGGVGLAIDTDSATLFVTFEGYNYVKIVDANTLYVPPGSVPAPGANNLAGIVVDQERQKVYAVNRSTNRLYQYSWDAVLKTLTLDGLFYLSSVYQAHGIALDETSDLLYVADLSNYVKVFNTSDWTAATTPTVYVATQRPMGIAIDEVENVLYTGNAYPPYGCTGHLVKTDLNTSPPTETSVNIRSISGGVYNDCVVGLAVDLDTGLVYITSGNQSSGGSDRIMVFDADLNHLYSTGDIGNPTGIVVPRVAITYNPLNLSKDDGLSEEGCVYPGDNITYQLCYDNTANEYDVENVTLVDILPSEVNYVSGTGGCSYNSSTHEATWDLGTLTAGAPQTCVQMVVTVDESTAPETEFTNHATISSDDTGPAYNNEATEVCPNQPPVADPDGPYLGAANSPISFYGDGSSDPDGDPLTYDWDFGDSDSSTEENPSHAYATGGIYDVCLTVHDGYVPSPEVCTMAVVYDPDAGFVTGGGWIDSLAGAYKPDLSLAGKANFGFVAKYKKGASAPDGQTEFQFHVADLNFHSSSYDWLVVIGKNDAMFKGSGTVNGMEGYRFMLWAGDSDPDTFRIRIWTEDESTSVETDLYDNGFHQALAGGSIVIHTK